ncbi:MULTISPECIES: hypothetical protein [Bacillus]|nr:hypothetical protein [Bacillus altitudinis]WOI43030.1 hypothetical protein RZ534_08945 [Bacillus altitudinis]
MKKIMMMITTALLLGTILGMPAVQQTQADAKNEIVLLSSRGAGS